MRYSDEDQAPTAYIDLGRIVHNYQVYCKLAAAGWEGREPPKAPRAPMATGEAPLAVWPSVMAVVKADAYGHGLAETALALQKAGVSAFAAGSVWEAVRLRRTLIPYPSGEGPLVIALLGFMNSEEASLCRIHGVIPLLHSFEQLGLIREQGILFPFTVAIKCNTGMSRLGFNEEELAALKEELRFLPWIKPVLALSHLHSAGEEGGWENVRGQALVFRRMLDSLREVWPEMAASLANSAGLCFAKEIAELTGPQISRAGLGLYGLSPMPRDTGSFLRSSLLPAMSVGTPILATRRLRPGDGLGYGHAYTAKRAMNVGFAAAGYADGLFFALSNRGGMCVAGRRAPILGRVCMQMTALDLGESGLENASGQTAWILGGPHPNAVTAEEIASAGGTHVYEVVCSLGRNRRIHVDE
ncbi:MAG: alanine racemase [Zoogloeaceae bacterium]|jgi:alanine racemase|nr:alanine racemase [Zoogloeaceae bacterium]